jgi:hypothetical protein
VQETFRSQRHFEELAGSPLLLGYQLFKATSIQVSKVSNLLYPLVMRASHSESNLIQIKHLEFHVGLTRKR